MAQKLFEEFDDVSAKAWKQKIQYDLKGADYNEALIWESPEGIQVKPFYHSEDLKDIPQFNITAAKTWEIGQEIFAGDARKANQKAFEILQSGAESLIFNIPSAAIKVQDLLNDIDVNTVAVDFNFQFLSSDYVNQILEYFKTPESRVHLNLDIIGHLARTGNWFHNLKKDHEILDNITSRLELEQGCSALSIDLSLYQNAGAHIVQQLAYSLAHANEYLNHGFLNQGQGIVFKVAIGSNYFFEIAKIKALRILWRTLAQEYKVSTECHITATPSKRNKTLYEYNANMLRTTSECMSAILGGADTVINLAYDAIYHKDNAFGERLARNQLLVLKNESHLDKVTNPAEGAYYIETLTAQLAEKALTLFKGIEASGGFLKQLKDHTIQKKIKESAHKEQMLFDKSEEILIGANKYQHTIERMKDEMELYPFLKTDKRKTLIVPLLEKRLSEALEQKRLKDE